jgi:prepilin-type N-terminal cleavage/methylation domain-containing protein
MSPLQITKTKRQHGRSQDGFTLMEIIVATAIFVTVVSSILVLFNYVLKINRKVQAVRQVAQGSRNFTEVLSREIRNGRIDYSQPNGTPCAASNYSLEKNQSLSIESYTGEITCLYLDSSGLMYLTRSTPDGISQPQVINPPNFIINPDTFRFIVRPTVSPFVNNQGMQPFVTILAEFVVFKGSPDEQVIPYQTTISSDVYDIPSL